KFKAREFNSLTGSVRHPFTSNCSSWAIRIRPVITHPLAPSMRHGASSLDVDVWVLRGSLADLADDPRVIGIGLR
ncbi:hypothetical protein ACWGTI_33010, partial [Mesorhizobium sp. ArgA1]